MGERVLIVDDNPTNLKLVAYLVTANGYEVDTAADAEHGARRDRREPAARDPDGSAAARHRRSRADAPAQGRPGDRRHQDHRGHRVRDEGRPGEGARGGVRRLRHQADRHPRACRR